MNSKAPHYANVPVLYKRVKCFNVQKHIISLILLSIAAAPLFILCRNAVSLRRFYIAVIGQLTQA